MKMQPLARLTICAAALLAFASVHASTLYWDSDATGTGNSIITGAGLGGTGNWDASTLNWWPGIGTTDQAWVNANNDTAAFWGTAGTVTLTDAITVGGLLFNTTGYTIASGANTLTFGAASDITLNNVAAATITGAVAGTGSVNLTGGVLNGSTAGTITFNGTSTTGWSGATTNGAGMTMALAGSSQALASTSGITLNGGGITLTNTSIAEAALNRVANGAGVTSNGGTFTVTNTSLASTAYAETIGTVALTSGQLNVISTNNNTAGTSQTLTLSGLTHTGAANTSTVAFGGGSLGASAKNSILITGQATPAISQIIGPWATYGSTAALQTDYATYNRAANNTTNTFGVQAAAIGSSTENFWTNASQSATQNAAQTLTANRTITALRSANAAPVTTQLGAFNLGTFGLLNGSTALWTISASGAGVIRQNGTAAANLYVTTGAGAIAINAPIADNTGALTLVKSGIGGTLTLSGVNTYSGATVVNAGVLATGSLADGSSASGIGQSTSVAANLVLAGGTLQYTGAAQNTDRLFSVGLGGGTLDASGTGALNFTNTGSMGFNSQTGVRTLTLTGTNTGANALAAVIGDNTGATTLIKSGSGTWVLSGANTYTGSTFVNAGTLVADTTTNATVLSSSSGLVLGGGTFQLKGNTGTQSQILNGLTLGAGASSTVDANNLGTSTTLDLTGSGGTLGIARTTGTVDFKANTGTLGTTAIIKTAQANDANGILGAWATVNGGADLAINNGSNVVTAYTGYTDIDALGSTIVDATATNVRLNTATGGGNVVLGSTTTNINTLMQNTATASTVDIVAKTLRLGTAGGILITPTSAALTIGTASNSGTLTAGGNATNTAGELILSNNSASTLTINSAITNNGTGVVSLTKSGSGLAVITGSNTFTGTTSIGAGTLQIGAGGATGALATTGTIVDNGILLFNRSAAITQGTHFSTAAITGTGSVIQVGTGTLTLNAANSFTGGLIVKSGTVAGGASGNSFGANTSIITLGDSTGGSSNTILSGVAATYANPITVASTNTGTATITTNNAAPIFSGLVTLNTHDLTLSTPSAFTNLTLSGGLTGTGNLLLNAASSGIITVSGAINIVGTITNTGAGSPSNGNQVTGSIGSSVTGIIQDSNTATLALDGANSAYNNGITIKKGQLNGLHANALGASTNVITLGDSSGSSSASLGGGAGAINLNPIMVAAGNTGVATMTQTYSNNANFSGLITMNSHSLTLSTITGGPGNLTIGGGLVSTGTGGNLTLNSQSTGVITISGATSVNHVGTITNLGTGSASNVISSVVGTNVTGVIQNSATSKLTLSGANIYTGATTVTLGTLQAGIASVANTSGAFGKNSAVTMANAASAILNITGFNTQIGSLTGGGLTGGNVTLGAATLTLGGDNTSPAAYAGVISGTGAVTKIGTGTQTFTGANTYAGTTTITAGTLVLNANNSTTGVDVQTSGTLAGSGKIAGAISGAGQVGPGNSPGILTATQVNPAGGLDFNFEFTATGGPTYANAATSVNDVLHLNNVTTPFTADLTSSNTISLYLNVVSIADTNVFQGGFFTDRSADFLTSIQDGTLAYYVKGDGGGANIYNGVNYYTLAQYNTVMSSTLSINLGTAQVASAAFADGTISNGYISELSVVPEPATWGLLAFSLTTILVLRRRKA